MESQFSLNFLETLAFNLFQCTSMAPTNHKFPRHFKIIIVRGCFTHPPLSPSLPLPQLSYLGDGELEDVRVSIKWYEYILKFGKENHSSIFTGMPSEYIMVCYREFL